ncbi:MAG: MT-A70 family methyltransferase [Pseudomonadota bacterium]
MGAIFQGGLDKIPLFSYDFIMADPNWSFDNWSAKGEVKNAKRHYRCDSVGVISQYRVSDIAAPDCLLWLWATNPMLPQALMVMERWGFRFKTAGYWVKWNAATNKVAFGPGYILRGAGEPFLIGTIGSPKTTRSVRSVVMGLRREHSRKPEEGYQAAEALMPNARRIELFSRCPRDGWDTWGDEATKFEGAA